MKYPEKILLQIQQNGDVSKEDFLKSLDQANIKQFDQLADIFFDIFQREKRPHNKPNKLSLKPLVQEQIFQKRKEINPKVPFLFDNILYDPKDISKIRGRNLYFYAFKKNEFENHFLIFDNPNNYLQQLIIADYNARLAFNDWPGGSGGGGTYGGGAPGGSEGVPHGTQCGFMGTQPCTSSDHPSESAPPSYGGTLKMFEDAHYQSNWLWLEPYWEYNDLTQVNRGNYLFWSGNWNDEISSISKTDSHLILYEHINFQGIPFYVGKNTPIDDFDKFGFNDRISSVRNLGG